MLKHLLTLIIVSVVTLLCIPGLLLYYNTYGRFYFTPTASQQEAVFYTEFGHTGGGGDPVIENLYSKRRISYKGLPVVLHDDSTKLIYEKVGKQPSGRHGGVIVKARVHLELLTVMISTNPPSPKQVYSLIVEQVHYAIWHKSL